MLPAVEASASTMFPLSHNAAESSAANVTMAAEGIEARLNTSEKLTTVPLGSHVANGHPVCAIEIHCVPSSAAAHDGCGVMATVVQGAPLAVQVVAGVDVSVAAASWVAKRIRIIGHIPSSRKSNHCLNII